MPTPDELRARMAQSVNVEFNEGVAAGSILGSPIPVPGAPAPEQPAASGPPAAPASPETPSQEQGLIWNKYKDMEQAEKGYFHLLNTHTSAMNELSALRSRVAQMDQAPTASPSGPTSLPGASPGSRERVNPVSPAVNWAEDPTMRRVSEATGIDPADLGAIAQRALDLVTPTVNQSLDQRLAPMTAQAEADAYMRRNHPEALNHAQEIGLFVQSSPSAQRIITPLLAQNDYTAAFEAAWLLYSLNSGVGVQKQMQANQGVAEAERLQARAAAGLPSSPNTPVHAAVQQAASPSPEELQDLAIRAKQGDPNAAVMLRRHTFGRVLPPEMRTWERQA